MLGNVNQVTPQGTQTSAQTGSYTWHDPYTNQDYQIPQFTQTTAYSPEQQNLYNEGVNAQTNLAQLATSQSARLQGLLGTPFSLSNAPAAGNPSALQTPNYQQYAAAPQLATTFGDAGNIQRSIAGAGSIARDFGDAGAINRDYATSFDDAGDITKTYSSDFSADRDKVQAALMARMQPQLDSQREALETRLANTGARGGSTAYDTAQFGFGRQVNDANMAAILSASEEQARMVGMERDRAMFENSAQGQNYDQLAGRAQFNNQGIALGNQAQQQNYDQLLGRATFGNNAQAQQYGQNANDAAFANSAQSQAYQQLFGRAQFGNAATQQNFGNQYQVTGANNGLQTQQFSDSMAQIQAQNAARQQFMQEQFAARNQPINEITALMSGSQVTQPQFSNIQMPTIPTTDTAGIINQNYAQQMQGYQQQQAGLQSTLGGLMGLGSSFIMSDRRTKENIEEIGKTNDNQPIFAYNYKAGGPRHIGLMAQEVEKKHPEAVTEIGGIKHVDYGKALGGLFAVKKAA